MRFVARGARKMSALIEASDAQQIVIAGFSALTNVNSAADLRAPGVARALRD